MNRLWLMPAALGAAGLLFTEELYRYTFCREGSRLLAPVFDRRGHEDGYYLARDAAAEALRQRKRERMEILSPRGERLRGFYYPLAGGGKRIAFLVHGYRSEHAENAGFYVDYYLSRGFDLFCPDLRAHGESEGRLIGFDSFESEDILRWLDALIGRFGEEAQIILHGFSMGAATVLRISDRCPRQLRFLVEDSGFASAEEQLAPSFGPLFGLMRAMHRVFAGCDLGETDVRPALERASLPILFVHGREDPTVAFRQGELLYELYRGPKACLFTEGTRHIETMYRHPTAYAEALDRMLQRS